jgi:hypothetical protein
MSKLQFIYTNILTVFDNAEKTEVFYGIEDVSKAILDYISASLLLESRAIRGALLDLKNKEINMRFITDY